ncbi:hypothetical protein LTR17_026975 [Elasticomyces elasticus]|nr:hypothetical protein LTR17_026975 [Elasticomyces elasticus]
MASKADGPHESTRHRKRTAAALLEPALDAPEKGQRTSATVQASKIVEVGIPIDTTADGVERRLNTHDSRLTKVETLTGALCTTVTQIEERLKPYDEYQEQALDAVKQLRELQSKLHPTRSASLSLQKRTASASLLRAGSEHEISIREQFDGRLHHVEKSIKLIANQPTSTHGLALLLISRLKGGDTLNDSTIMTLRLHLEGSMIYPSSDSNPTMQLVTPVPDESELVDPPREPSFAPPPDIVKPASRKRRRISNTSEKPAPTRRVRFESADLEPGEVDDALNSSKAGAFS